jgi:hypothetical protein
MRKRQPTQRQEKGAFGVIVLARHYQQSW